VKLIEGGKEYATPLRVTGDPRMTHTVADRKAQWDLSLRLYGMLNHMTGVVDRMNGVASAMEVRVAQRPNGDSLMVVMQGASEGLDTLRKRIVASKEGGAITGEERLRENLVELYGSLVNHKGRPSATQVARTDATHREMGDVPRAFEIWLRKELAPINSALATRNLQRIELLVPPIRGASYTRKRATRSLGARFAQAPAPHELHLLVLMRLRRLVLPSRGRGCIEKRYPTHTLRRSRTEWPASAFRRLQKRDSRCSLRNPSRSFFFVRPPESVSHSLQR